jgi:hypothetical protein
MIIANKKFRTRTWEAYRVMVLLPEMSKLLIKEQGYNKDAAPLIAFVNQGRWLVECRDCSGSEYAWEEGWFMCRSCWNSAVGSQYRPAVFPKDRAKIEGALVLRPIANRNWNPGETIGQLEAENLLHAHSLLKVG